MAIVRFLDRSTIDRLFNTALRLAALSLKLLLTLYMGKYLGLSEMGTYGLVAACAAISIPFLGFRLDYVVMREIVGKKDLALATMLRDQSIFYLLSYAVVSVIAVIYLYGLGIEGDTGIFLVALFICILESFATITSQNFSPLHRPIIANFLFFIRSASWVLPVVLIGYFNPEYRNAKFIFELWILGALLSLLVTAYVWRNLPWRDAFRMKVQWSWIWASVKKTIPIWISGICAALSTNVDRFIVEKYLGRDFVGLISFYGSFVVALSSLLGSGIFAFKYPHMIEAYRNGDLDQFRKITKNVIIEGSATAGIIGLVMGVSIPLLGDYLGRPEFSRYASTLWLMLFGVWLKMSTEGLYYVLYTRQQDRAIWMSNMLTLSLVLALNLLLVPFIGFIGVGYSALFSMLALSVWRIYSVKNFKPVERAN